MYLPDASPALAIERRALLDRADALFDGDLVALFLERYPRPTTNTLFDRVLRTLFCQALSIERGAPVTLPDAQALRSSHVNDYLESLGDRTGHYGRQGLDHATRDSYLSCLKLFFSWLAHWKVTDYNPASREFIRVKPRKIRRTDRSPVHLDQAEVTQLLEAALRRPVYGVRDFALLVVAIFSAMRRSEIAAMTTSSTQKRGRLAVISIPEAKGGMRQEVHVPLQVAEVVNVYVRRHRIPAGPLWINRRGDPLRAPSMLDLVASVARDAGLERRLTTHHLRHTSVMLALDGGANLHQVMQHARHQSSTSTDHYVRHSIQSVASSTDAISGQLGLPVHTTVGEPPAEGKSDVSVVDLLDRVLNMLAPDEGFEKQLKHQTGGDLVSLFLDRYDAQRSRDKFGRSLRAFSEWMGSQGRITPDLARSVTADTVADFQTHIRSEGYSRSYESNILGDLRVFFRWAADKRVVPSSPVNFNDLDGVGTTQTKRSPTKPLEKDQTVRLLHAASMDRGRRTGLRDEAMILTLLFGALHQKEMLPMTVNAVKPFGPGMVLTVNNGWGRILPEIYLPSCVRDAVERVKNEFGTEQGLIWRPTRQQRERPLRPMGITRTLKVLAQRAGIETPVNSRVLRTTFKHLGLETGVEEEAVLAHMGYEPRMNRGTPAYAQSLEARKRLALPEPGHEIEHVTERVWRYVMGTELGDPR